MLDLDLAMNTWMSDPFPHPTTRPNRGKRLSVEKLAEIERWGRYKDVDGDGVPYRTLPGTPGDGKGAYFARGSGHDEHARYTESGATYVRNMDRLVRKLETARGMLPAPVLDGSGSRVGILAYGTTHWAVVESRDQLRAERGMSTDYLRLKASRSTTTSAGSSTPTAMRKSVRGR